MLLGVGARETEHLRHASETDIPRATRGRLCALTHLKKGRVLHSPVWWDVRQIPLINKLIILLGYSTGGLGAQPLLGLVLTPRTGTLTSKSDLQLTDFLSHPGYIIFWHPPASCGVTIHTQFNPSTVTVIPWYLRPDVPVIHTGAFHIWQLGRVGGQYVTFWPSSSSCKLSC